MVEFKAAATEQQTPAVVSILALWRGQQQLMRDRDLTSSSCKISLMTDPSGKLRSHSMRSSRGD